MRTNHARTDNSLGQLVITEGGCAYTRQGRPRSHPPHARTRARHGDRALARRPHRNVREPELHLRHQQAARERRRVATDVPHGTAYVREAVSGVPGFTPVVSASGKAILLAPDEAAGKKVVSAVTLREVKDVGRRNSGLPLLPE